MSRLRRIEYAGRYFFITTNLARGVPSLTPKERDICLDHIALARIQHGFRLFAYVVMPNHVHLLLGVFQSSLPALMRDWKGRSALAIAKIRGARGPIWQPRYFDFILRRAADFGDKFAYIHLNPVAAGLALHPEDWRWSSYNFDAMKTAAPVRPDVFDVPLDPNTPLWPASWR